jgi:hypothetical protein
MQTHKRFGYLTDANGYSVEGNVSRARYKLQLSRALARDAINEARAIAEGAERKAWLCIAREAKRDARDWLQALRIASKQLAADATCNA